MDTNEAGTSEASAQRRVDLPSVDRILREPAAGDLVDTHGRTAVVTAIRAVLDEARAAAASGTSVRLGVEAAVAAVAGGLDARARPRARPVFNMTGTVLHTNLGRAVLAEEAVEAASAAMRRPLALEYDLESGRRGRRDAILEDLTAELTGAEAVSLVNNNAAATLLVLAALAGGREGIVSRGELVEIGGSYRIPEIMEAADVGLVEVGTTNRTHARDYRRAVGPQTAALVRVHTSNYRVEGFTSAVEGRELATIAREAGVPLIDDLGSGTLVDLEPHGLARERTVGEALAEGADIVTFSGDKLLGGPQAGFIVGRADLVAACNAHPMKRAMRLDKVRLAALEATLQLYRHPERLAERLPTLRMLSTPREAVRARAESLAPAFAAALGPTVAVAVDDCTSQIGSGALPLDTIPSAGLALSLRADAQTACADAPAPPFASLEALAARLRALPTPIVGRLKGDRLILDCRTVEDPQALIGMLGSVPAPG